MSRQKLGAFKEYRYLKLEAREAFKVLRATQAEHSRGSMQGRRIWSDVGSVNFDRLIESRIERSLVLDTRFKA